MDAKEKAQSWNRTVERRLFLRDTALTAAGLTGATLLGGVPAFSKKRGFMGVESEHRTLARALPAISAGNFSVRIQARSFLLREKFRLYGDAQYFSFFNLRPTGEASRIDLKRTPRRRGCGQRSR